ncbi:MAG: hypothetical protein N2508_02000 [Anaerolineae bacterium]|nr:hypothetical protein [Anaerolineae bacterium]
MLESITIWHSLLNGPHAIGRMNTIMWHVARGLSELTGHAIYNDMPVIEKVPIAEVSARAGNAEAKTVGVYFVLGGGIYGQAIIIMPVRHALNLADLMMGRKPGSATELGEMERSALAEAGNLTTSYFLNGVYAIKRAQELLRPSPPAVMVDMIGAILDVVLVPIAAVRDDLVIVESGFGDVGGVIKGRFWVLPDPRALDAA